jgi:NAD+ synthase
MRAADAVGVLFGLSGGIDSSTLAALCARAVEPGMVHAVYLYDRHSAHRLRACAGTVAGQLELDYHELPITAEMQARGLYASSGMRVTGIAGWFNRLLYKIYLRSTGETPFLSTLKAPGSQPDTWYASILAQAEAGMNARHRHRRQVLEGMALEKNWLLLGAANRSEWLVGWFVKGGVDDLPDQPLIGLYKTQVRQLAAELGLPACVLSIQPSPDMIPGITDEIGLNIEYTELDLILEHLQGGLSADELGRNGIGQDQIEYVLELMSSSSWKRESP